MAMNVPPEENQQPTTPIQPEVAETATPVEQAATSDTPAPTEQVPPEQAAAKDQQVVEAVAQGLADEEITAEDIMTAVLSDALGITPQGAQSLFRLLMSELVDEEEAVNDESATDTAIAPPPTSEQ